MRRAQLQDMLPMTLLTIFVKSIADESPTGGAKATYRPMCKESCKEKGSFERGGRIRGIWPWKKVALRGAVKLEESGPGGAEAAYRSEH